MTSTSNPYAFAVQVVDRHNSLVLYGATRAEVARSAVNAEQNDWDVWSAFELTADGTWAEIDIEPELAAAEAERQGSAKGGRDKVRAPRWWVYLEGPLGPEPVNSADSKAAACEWAVGQFPPPVKWTVDFS